MFRVAAVDRLPSHIHVFGMLITHHHLRTAVLHRLHSDGRMLAFAEQVGSESVACGAQNDRGGKASSFTRDAEQLCDGGRVSTL